MTGPNQPLRVMKFGGTSVGDATCIRKVVEIVRDAAHESRLIVVVSAMSGVTNALVEAATRSETGDRHSIELIFQELRARHSGVITELIQSFPLRSGIGGDLESIFQDGERLCLEAASSQELDLQTRDSISSLGERLLAPIVSAALREAGLSSQPVEATELIVTNSIHGAADPLMAATRRRCEARLAAVIWEGMIPVVTGFIGATEAGVLTTFGRGGSDYSATILGAALGADEVTIWTDVDGLLTTDPRLVPDASIIAEISYAEAAELAHGGAKVLHPKTLSPVAASGIPVWIRNTFAPQRMGTRITPAGPATEMSVRGLAVMEDAADPTRAVVTAVGKSMRDPDVIGCLRAALGSKHLNIVSIPNGSSDHSFSFVVPKKDLKRTLEAIHREFHLDTVDALNSAQNMQAAADAWEYAPGTASAD